VKNGLLNNKEPSPVNNAIIKPIGTKLIKLIDNILSIVDCSKEMYINKNASNVVKPPTNPPPGVLCPANNKYIPKPSKIKLIKEVIDCKMIYFCLITYLTSYI